MTDLDQRITSTLRERAEGQVDIDRLTSRAVAQGRARRVRRRATLGGTAFGVAAVLGLGVAGGGALPVEVPWTAAKPAAPVAAPAPAAGVPNALARPDLVGTDPSLLHFGVDPARARYLSWQSALDLESAQLDLGGAAPVRFNLARSAEVAEELDAEGAAHIPEPATPPFDGQVVRVPRGGADSDWILRWQPAPGLFARLHTVAPNGGALQAARNALRFDAAYRCGGPLRLSALPEGARITNCGVWVERFPAGFNVSLVVIGSGDKLLKVDLQYAKSIVGARTDGNRMIGDRPAFVAEGGLNEMELLGFPKAHLTAIFGWPTVGGSTEADAATVLGGAQVAEHLDQPETW